MIQIQNHQIVYGFDKQVFLIPKYLLIEACYPLMSYYKDNLPHIENCPLFQMCDRIGKILAQM